METKNGWSYTCLILCGLLLCGQNCLTCVKGWGWPQVVSSPWGGVVDPQRCLNGLSVSSVIHTNAKIQGFPTEQCMVTKRSMLLISLDSGFNVAAYRCRRLVMKDYFFIHFAWLLYILFHGALFFSGCGWHDWLRGGALGDEHGSALLLAQKPSSAPI